MTYLIIVSMIWAISFGLIKGNLTGLDSDFVAFARLAISFIFFLPFIRFTGLKFKIHFSYLVLGAIQFGLMYIFYIYSYQYISAWQIALFTIFTPLYVTIINDLFDRNFNGIYLLAAVFSVLGAAVIVLDSIDDIDLQMGFLFMQLSNICFAVGQVWYARLKKSIQFKDVSVFPWLYMGAVIVSGANSIINDNYTNLTLSTVHIYTLLYLGIIASGICFFLWNLGATKVNAGSLAVLNNLKVPLGIAASLLVFGEDADSLKMLIGGVIILGALILSEKKSLRQKVRSGINL